MTPNHEPYSSCPSGSYLPYVYLESQPPKLLLSLQPTKSTQNPPTTPQGKKCHKLSPTISSPISPHPSRTARNPPHQTTSSASRAIPHHTTRIHRKPSYSSSSSQHPPAKHPRSQTLSTRSQNLLSSQRTRVRKPRNQTIERTAR